MFITRFFNLRVFLTLAALGVTFAVWQMFFAPKSFTVSAQEAPQALAGGGLECFLKIDGVKGESEDRAHRDEIELSSFSWGESNTGAGGVGSGGGAGKVQMQDFHFSTPFSAASPVLAVAVATGKHFPNAVMTCRKSGKEQQDFLKWTLKDVLVSSYKTEGKTDPVPTDSFSLNFSSIAVEYKQQKADGSAGAPVQAGWDLKDNKEL